MAKVNPQIISEIEKLSKKDKKIARSIIEKGLQTEYENSLHSCDAVLQQWKNKTTDNREAYMQLYDTLFKCDKHIGLRYNDITGSKYLHIIAAQLYDEVINEDDLKELSDEAKKVVITWAGFNK